MTDQSIPTRREVTAQDEANLSELVTDERFSSVWLLADNALHAIAANGLFSQDEHAHARYESLMGFVRSLRAYLPSDGDDAAGEPV